MVWASRKDGGTWIIEEIMEWKPIACRARGRESGKMK